MVEETGVPGKTTARSDSHSPRYEHTQSHWMLALRIIRMRARPLGINYVKKILAPYLYLIIMVSRTSFCKENTLFRKVLRYYFWPSIIYTVIHVGLVGYDTCCTYRMVMLGLTAGCSETLVLLKPASGVITTVLFSKTLTHWSRTTGTCTHVGNSRATWRSCWTGIITRIVFTL
jgi:hypothetical protein